MADPNPLPKSELNATNNQFRNAVLDHFSSTKNSSPPSESLFASSTFLVPKEPPGSVSSESSELVEKQLLKQQEENVKHVSFQNSETTNNLSHENLNNQEKTQLFKEPKVMRKDKKSKTKKKSQEENKQQNQQHKTVNGKRKNDMESVEDVIRKKVHMENNESSKPMHETSHIENHVSRSESTTLSAQQPTKTDDLEHNCFEIHDLIEDSNNENLALKQQTPFGEGEDDPDFFDLDLGIKILDEVFLCSDCQNEIPKQDLKGTFQEFCSNCLQKPALSDKISDQQNNSRSLPIEEKEPKETWSNIQEKEPQKTWPNIQPISVEKEPQKTWSNIQPISVNKEPQKTWSNIQPISVNKEPQKTWPNIQPPSLKVVPSKKRSSKIDKTNLFFGKELQFENEIANPVPVETNDAWTDILDPKYNNPKLLCVGTNYQADLPKLNLYNDRRREIKRLWNPKRLHVSLFEKLEKEMKSTFKVTLTQEELAELLVRNEWNCLKVLDWCKNSKQEFRSFINRNEKK